MEYSHIFKQAYQSTKKYKAMWWLGLFAAGSASVNLPANFARGFGSAFSDSIPSDQLAFTNWFSQYWVFVVAAGILLLLLALIFFVMDVIAYGGMYHGANLARHNQRPTFGGMIKVGAQKFWPLLGMSSLVAICILAGMVIIAIPLILLGFTIVGLVIVIPVTILLVLALIPFTIAVSMTMKFAQQYMVLQNKSIMESLKLGWKLLRSHLGDSIIIFLLQWLIGIGIALVTFMATLLIAIPFAIIGFVAYQALNWPALVAVVAVGVLVLFVLFLVIKGIVQTFTFNVWHLTFAEFNQLP